MPDNPIKYSEFIQPDDSITNLITQLETVQTGYIELGKTIVEQAKRIEDALKKVSSTTKDNQEEIEKSAEETEKLKKAEDDLNKSREETAKQLASLKAQRQKQNQVNKLTAKLNSSLEGSYDKLSAQYSLNKIRLNAMSSETRKATKEGQKLEKQTEEIYSEMKKLQEATGKTALNVGNYKDSVSEALAEQDFFGVSLTSLKDKFTGVTGAIGAGIAIITGLTKAYASSARGAEDLARASDRLGSISRGIGNLIADATGETNLFDDALRAVQERILGLQSALISDIEVGIKSRLREIELSNLAQEQRKKELLNAAEVQRQIRDDERNSFEVRKQANNDLAEIISKREEETIAFQEKKLKEYRTLLALDKNNIEVQQQIKQIEFEIADAREEAQGFRSEQLANDLALSREFNQNQLTLTQKRIEGEIILTEEGSEERFQLEKKLIDNTKALQLEAAGDNKQLRAIAIQEAINAERELINRYKQIREQDAKAREEASKRQLEKQKAANKKAEQERINSLREEYNAYKSFLDQEYEFRLSEIDLMKTTEAEKTKLRLKAERDRLQAIIDLNKQGLGELSGLQIKTMENTIKKINEKIDAPENKSYDLYSLAGINLDDEKKEAINESTQFAIANVTAFLNAKIDASNRAVEASQREIDAAQSRLDAEIEARNNGYASNVSAAQRELALAKRTQDAALREQQKAQRAQLAIETIQQASSLTTASAKIWGQLGFPWAIPALAFMWGSFAAAKIKAFQVTRTREFAEGGLEVLGGGTHASGNDTVIGYNNGYQLRGEKDEAVAVINRSKTRKYKKILPDVINALNKGTFEKKYGNAYELGVIADSGKGSDLRGLESDVKAIRKQGEKSIVFDNKGNKVVTYKNLKRTYYAN